jgi:hypothetical protein
MNHVITTFILLALAVKAKAQSQDSLINRELREKSTGKKEVANYKGGP